MVNLSPVQVSVRNISKFPNDLQQLQDYRNTGRFMPRSARRRSIFLTRGTAEASKGIQALFAGSIEAVLDIAMYPVRRTPQHVNCID